MSDNRFTVEDNQVKLFSGEEIKVSRKRNDNVSMVWAMSFQELVDLQTSIATFIAGERLG